jgi:uncharacterized small protein (DUF1192 family)
MDKDKRSEMELTEERKQKIRAAQPQQETLELNVEELEERIAPMKFV